MRDPRTGTELGPSAVIPVPAQAPPAAPPPPDGRRVPVRVQIEELTDELLTALHNYRVAKRVLAARTAMLENRHGPTAEADIAGRSDYRKTKAAGDVAWWRGEVMAASNALIALRSLTGGTAHAGLLDVATRREPGRSTVPIREDPDDGDRP